MVNGDGRNQVKLHGRDNYISYALENFELDIGRKAREGGHILGSEAM